MPAPNVFSDEWDFDRPNFRATSVARRAGAERLGGTVYELQPGSTGTGLHLHHAIEELVVVLRGRPTLRTLEDERELEPGDVVAFPLGRRGAHTLENRTDEAVRYLMFSTIAFPDVTENPERGMITAYTHLPWEAPREGQDPEDAFFLMFKRADAE